MFRSRNIHSQGLFYYIFKLFPIIWVTLFLGIITFWILIGVATIRVVSHIDDEGLKNVVERVWEGPKK